LRVSRHAPRKRARDSDCSARRIAPVPSSQTLKSRVQLVRRHGRDVSTLYRREGGGGTLKSASLPREKTIPSVICGAPASLSHVMIL